jgi:hypothetical protein
MKYKISFLGSPVGSFKREEYTIVAECDSDVREIIIVQAIYKGKNEKSVKYYNVSWDSITIKVIKGKV